MAVPFPSFVGGVYWRKSMFNGAKCVPAILILQNARLSLATDTEQAFDASLHEIAVQFSRFHTMTITRNGHAYAIVGRGAAISPDFTMAQTTYLTSAWHAAENGAPVVVVTVPPATNSPSDLHSLRRLEEKWRPVFQSVGIPVT